MASARFVRGMSQEQEVDATARALVGSLDLPPDLAARIRDIIARSVAARNDLPSQITERVPLETGGTMIPGIWGRTMLLIAERNAAIQSLLTDPEQRRMFEANAFDEMHQLASTRPVDGTT